MAARSIERSYFVQKWIIIVLDLTKRWTINLIVSVVYLSMVFLITYIYMKVMLDLYIYIYILNLLQKLNINKWIIAL